jgi:hypothetical protein
LTIEHQNKRKIHDFATNKTLIRPRLAAGASPRPTMAYQICCAKLQFTGFCNNKTNVLKTGFLAYFCEEFVKKD